MVGPRQHVYMDLPRVSVDPKAFRADADPSWAQLFQPRRMSVNSSTNSMSNLNNFQPIYNTDEPIRPRPRPYPCPLHINLNALVEAFM